MTSLAALPGGWVLISGDFTSSNGAPRRMVARLLNDTVPTDIPTATTIDILPHTPQNKGHGAGSQLRSGPVRLTPTMGQHQG